MLLVIAECSERSEEKINPMFFGSLGKPDIAGAVVTTFAVAACTSAIAASV